MAMVKEAVKETRPGVEFGISPSGIWQNKQSSPLGSDTNGFESYSRIFADSRLWVTDEVVDYIVPQIYWAIGTKGSDYETLAKWWRHVTLGTNVKLYIGHAAYRVGADDVWKKPTEIGSQIAMNRMLGAIDGSVFYGYSKIAENALGLRDQLKEFFTDMELAQPLQIAYPASGSTVAAANSYVIGSADPRYPLFLDGKQVDCTVSGYFSLYLPLNTGENEFVFTHQGEELLYMLNSNWSPPTPGSGSGSGGSSQGPKVTVLPKPLVYITKGDQTVVRAEASSSATRLQPLKKGVKGYVTAEANGYYLMDSGNWTYKPNVDILAGESLPICLARSAAVTRSGKTVDISFQLPYFPSYYVEVAEGEVCLTLHQTIGQPLLRADSDPLFGEIQFQQAGPHAVYTLPLQKAGRLYGYHIRYDQEANTLTFRFNNPLTLPLYTAAAGGGAAPGGQTPPGPAATGLTAPGATASAGQAAAGAAASAGQAAAEPPAAMLPLAGKVIVLDAGHGGKDNGATGPAGSRGKLEKDVNLDLALTLEKVLTEAGAEVRMIRTEDVGIDLEIRADAIREIKPDLAISLHRNSMGAGSDIRLYQGVLALYSHPQSIPLARCLSEALVKGTTHQDGGMRWQSLAMCRIEECPTVLLELGFISNPADYERMNRKSTIQKEARAILQGLIAYMAGS
jgi:N-acetylmuramoyl-L-alanine amidase